MAVASAVSEFASKAMFGSTILLYGIRIKESNRVWSVDLKTYFRKRKRKKFNSVALSSAKRKLILPSDYGEKDRHMSSIPNQTEDINQEGKSSKDIAVDESNACFPDISMVGFEIIKNNDDVRTRIISHKEISGFDCISHLSFSLVKRENDSQVMKSIHTNRFSLPSSSNDLFSEIISKNKAEGLLPSISEEDKKHNAYLLEAGFGDYHSCRSPLGYPMEDSEHQATISGGKGVYGAEDDLKVSVPSNNVVVTGGEPNGSFASRSQVKAITMSKETSACIAETQANFLLTGNCSSGKQPSKSLSKSKGTCKNYSPPKGVLTESLEYNETINIPQKNYQKFCSLKDKSKHIDKHNAYEKENSLHAKTMTSEVEQKELPQFDNFIIEDEEGSGGYGTVYRARRKSDGKRFAVKCPHAQAHKNHVNNELKILERFGGRNFIVNYEGLLKNGDTECFILEHVDHDRPEVLKKEIDIFQLRWYGYCLFSALSFLHNKEVVHRDVKPGNFLFSRKLCKGVLVDFNLSMDLLQKHAVGNISKSSFYASNSHVPPPHPRSAQSAKVVTDVHLAVNLQEPATHKKPSHQHKKSVKKRANSTYVAHSSIVGFSKCNSQVADGSGLNSTKDAASTRNLSTERTNEPLPSLGRKELISLVQNVMQSPNHDALKNPGSHRKRIAAPSAKILYISPMPLHSNRVSVAGSGLLKSKVDGNKKREGPCFGTKGFRAPEVLFGSLHQGPKMDVWSAGVTVLCLMIGRTPFTGEPEQNIKEIAKLRGSEDLWEVSKLHDREFSFPMELLDIRFLPAMELRSWCKAHTRRPEFFKLIPRSLFDLIDKCLTVNPRLRISAEEALQHDFFAPCHESLSKRGCLGIR